MSRSNLYVSAILGGAFAGAVITAIVFSVFMARIQSTVEEIRRNQILNSDRARTQRDHLESKIDSFLHFNKK